ncbi:serine--tRNA ligase, partial [bacterium]|nr:serine--tRNA ligase [bacterium]
MLTAQFIRENFDRVQHDLLARNAAADLPAVLALDDRRRTVLHEVESLRAERNAASREIGKAKDSSDRQAKIDAMRAVGDRIDALDAELKTVGTERQALLYEIPNVLDPRVPIGPDESANVVVEECGKKPSFNFTPRPHWELG